jgi:6-phosphogluconolactonase
MPSADRHAEMRDRTHILAPALLALLAGCGSDQPVVPAAASDAGGQGVPSSQAATAAADALTVGGTVSGLQGTGLTLQLNGGQGLSIAANGTFTFPTAMTSGSSYAVTVMNQPSTQREVCSASNASGTIEQANISNVSISCSMLVGFIYSVSGNNLVSYGISPGTGALLPTGYSVSAGLAPGNVVSAPDGKHLYLAHLDNGDLVSSESNITVYAVNSDTGTLTVVGSPVITSFQPQLMMMSSSGVLFVYGQDVPPIPGLPPASPTSTLSAYVVDASSGTLSPTATAMTFQGPTSFVATPDGKFLYVLNDPQYGANVQTLLPTLTAYAIDASTGALTAGPVISPNINSMTMAIDPLGRFLYLTSDQGDAFQSAATVLPYAIDSNTGAVTAIGAGTPVPNDAASLAADPSGRYLYMTNALNFGPANDSVMALAVDQTSGAVSLIGPVLLTDGTPFLVICDPSGQFVYIASVSSTPPSEVDIGNLSAYAISTSAATAGQLLPQNEQSTPGGSIPFVVIE